MGQAIERNALVLPILLGVPPGLLIIGEWLGWGESGEAVLVIAFPLVCVLFRAGGALGVVELDVVLGAGLVRLDITFVKVCIFSSIHYYFNLLLRNLFN